MAGATPLAAQRVSDRAHSGAACGAVGRADWCAVVCAGFGLGFACAAHGVDARAVAVFIALGRGAFGTAGVGAERVVGAGR